VVVEDTHWADAATHDLLMLLGRRIERIQALRVLTYRDDELDDGHPLRATLAALPRAVVRGVPVPPLSRRCVAEQAGAAPAAGSPRSGPQWSVTSISTGSAVFDILTNGVPATIAVDAGN
jgi:hypothetical protein